MSAKDPSSLNNDLGAPSCTETDGAFSWLGHPAEREQTPIIELSVADLEPDEADLALQDLLDDPDGVRLAGSDLTAFAARFVAELLGEDDDDDDISEDPTVKIRVRAREPELDPREWSDGFCALGDVVGVHERLAQAGDCGCDELGAAPNTSHESDPAWFATSLPTRPPAAPRPIARRRSIAVLGASSVMTALVIAVLLGLPLEPASVAAPARTGLASILESGPSRSLESLATVGPIGDELDADHATEPAPPAEPSVTCDELTTLNQSVAFAERPCFEQGCASEQSAAPAQSCAREQSAAPEQSCASEQSGALEQSIPGEQRVAPEHDAAGAARPTVERSPSLSAESLTAADLERLALAHFDAGELDAAIATAELWTTVSPENAGSYLCLGAALLDRGRVAEARGVFRRCVENAKGPAVGECMAFVGRR